VPPADLLITTHTTITAMIPTIVTTPARALIVPLRYPTARGGTPPRAINPQRAKPTPQLCGTGPRPPTSHRYPRPAGCGGPWMPAVPRQQKWRLPRQQRPRLLPAGSISSHRVSHDPAGPRRAALPFAFGSISRISAVGASGTRRKRDSAQVGLGASGTRPSSRTGPWRTRSTARPSTRRCT
jgi:hypothetical protein